MKASFDAPMRGYLEDVKPLGCKHTIEQILSADIHIYLDVSLDPVT